jgi:hypothetical protein
MKAPLLSTLLLALAGTSITVPVQAQCLENFVNSCLRDCKRNNCWPEPFVRTDRAAVRIPFDIMIHRGWQEQNLISGHYFKEDGTELNEAGQVKVRWILTDAPRQHRTIYVQFGSTPQQTATRVAAVQDMAGRYVTASEQMPQVVPVAMSAASWSAEQADAVGRKFQSTMPDPRLPEVKDETK